MSGPSRVDPATLGWVKTEIDQTIENARNALAEFTPGSDITPLRMYASHLHLVVGTLQMVELYGAANLAQEAEQLADAVIRGGNGDGQAPGLLETALEKLSEYLEKLAQGMPDLPMQNVEVLNKLRLARGESPVDEAALFNPDLNVFPPDHDPKKLGDEEYSHRALQLRRDYQNRLLSWLRNADIDVLGSMRDIVDRLLEISRFGAVSQLWWVAGAYLDLLQETAMEGSDPRKRLLGQLDQQIRRLVEDGEAALVRDPPEQLVKSMLYEIGRSQVQTNRTQQIKDLFELDLILTGVSPEYFSAMAQIPSADALQKLGQHARTHLATAQSKLSEYFGPNGHDNRTMITVIENVTAVSAAAKHLEISGIVDLSGEIAKVCVAIKEGKDIDVDGASLQLAAALLFIDESLKSDNAPGIDWNDQIEDKILRLRRLYADPLDLEKLAADGMEVKEEKLSETDFKRVLGAVASEVYVNLKKSEEGLEAFAIEPSRAELLRPVSQQLDQVQGALRILGQHRVGDLLEAAIENIDKLEQGQIRPSGELIDALAVVIGTTETYVTGLQQDRPNLTDIVDRAMTDLENAVTHRSISIDDARALVKGMHEDLDIWLRDNADYRAFRNLRQSLRDISAVASRREKAKPRQIAQEMNNLLDIVTEDASFLSAEVETTLRRSLTTLEGMVDELVDPDPLPVEAADLTPATDEQTATTDTARMDVVSGGSDDDLQSEILGVFLEEGAECVGVMDSSFSLWRQDPQNTEALTDLRRQFHTMKGSGRIAEAGEIAELAWIVEDVLNQVIANKLGTSDELYEFVTDATTTVRDLLQAKLANSSEVDLDAWRERAEKLSQFATADAGQAGATQAALGIDDTVIRIFSQETLAHIETLRQVVDDCHKQPSTCVVSAELSRAVHTLRGSSRSLHLVEMADTFGALDTLLESYLEKGASLQSADLELLESIAQLSARTLDKLNQERRFPEVIRREFVELKENIDTRMEGGAIELRDSVPVVAEPVDAEETTGLEDQINALEDLIPREITEEVRSATEPPDDEGLDLHDIFCEEAVDILVRVNDSLQKWRTGGSADDAVAALKRDLHTLKGSARAAGATTVGDLSHNTESLLEHLRDRPQLVGSELMQLIEEVHDSLANLVHQMEQRETLSSIDELNQRLLGLDARLHAGEPMANEPDVPVKPGVSEAIPAASSAVTAQPPREARAPQTPVVEQDERPHTMPAAAALRGNGPEYKTEQPEVNTETEKPVERPMRSAFEDLEEQSEATMMRSLDVERAVQAERSASPVETLKMPTQVTAIESAVRTQATPAMPMAAAVGDDSETSLARDAAGSADPRSQVRVKAQVLNQLMNYAGEVSIARSQLQEQLSGFRGNLSELRANVTRFNEQIRELEIQADAQIRSRNRDLDEPRESEFDPLEFDRYTRLQQLSRSLSESLDDLVTIQGGLSTFANKTELVLRQQAHLSTDLQDGLMSTRLVPFATVVPRLRHEVRQVSRELNKDAELEVHGSDVEIDRNILDSMSEAFAHMIRNALGHGIESAERRAELGKPKTGRIRIECRQEGGEIVLRFSDDGAGLVLDKIRTRALENGLLKKDSQLSDEELTQLILLSGFSTADELTKLSGRGIGMDVVHNSVRRLGGTMTVETNVSGGASFLLHLPLSLSITQALFVRCGAQEFAIALNVIQTILKVEANKLGSLSKDGEPLFERDGQVYPLLDLGRQLEISSGLEESDLRVPILMVRMGAREVAVKVDDLIGTQEVVVKNLGEHLAGVNGIAGATIRGDGTVALILDLAELWLAQERLPVAISVDEARAPSGHAVPIVMVVDDSLTVRKVTSRNLSRYGMEVMMAKDGIDAMEQIRKTIPDLMLVDIEMPRMDGYELTSKIRSDPATKDIPIVIITSRSGEKHRERALELGANAYLSKPYQEEELIAHIKALLDQTPANFPTAH